MTFEQELIAGARREMLRNIAVAPLVLLIRLPLGLIYGIATTIIDALDWANGWLLGFRMDYAKALRAYRKRDADKATLLPERPNP